MQTVQQPKGSQSHCTSSRPRERGAREKQLFCCMEMHHKSSKPRVSGCLGLLRRRAGTPSCTAEPGISLICSPETCNSTLQYSACLCKEIPLFRSNKWPLVVIARQESGMHNQIKREDNLDANTRYCTQGHLLFLSSERRPGVWNGGSSFAQFTCSSKLETSN